MKIESFSRARRRGALLLGAVALATVFLGVAGCSGSPEQITIYSSRTQSLVQPLLEDYAEQTGQDITVRYMSTASLVATLQEEGDQTPADVVYLAEPGGLGALSEAGLLSELPDDILNRVEDQFRAANGEWVGVSGRAKVVVYNRENINPEEDLPDSIMDFTDPQWEGRIGWAPTHGEWQALLTAIRVVEGEEAAREWVRGIQDNDPRSFPNLISIVQGAAEGDVDVGFVNHYYAHRFIDEAGEDFGARNYYLGAGDAGSLVNVSGAAIPDAAEQRGEAEDFIEFLLGEEAQEYFTQETKEYPLIDGVEPAAEVPPLSSLSPPDVDLGEMSDVQGTIELLRSEGIIP